MSPLTPSSSRRTTVRPWAVLVVVTCLAGLALGVGYLARSRGNSTVNPDERSELHDLMAAAAAQATRPVKGRLAGGWSYAPSRPFTRGGVDAETSPEVLIAAARIQQAAAADDSPVNRASLGVAQLLIGDVDHAIESLQEAVQRDEDNARFQSDLSAALMARAELGANGEDWAASLDAAERALRRDPRQVEAHFNRALALEGLHLTEQAIDAHVAYQHIESNAQWLDESHRHLQELRRLASPKRLREDGSLDPSASSRPVDHQLIRERIEDQLLPSWARAVREGTPDAAARALDEARQLGTQVADAGGDTMALDEVNRITRAQAASNDRVLRDLAAGHVLFGQAREEYVRDNQQRAAELMTKAAASFTRAGSPYAAWAPVYRSLWLRNQGAPQRALDELSRVDLKLFPSSYRHLQGRTAWASGVAIEPSGRLDLAAQSIARAVAEYLQAGEVDNLIATRTILAVYHWYLGNTSGAWTDLLGVLEHIERNGGTRRGAHFAIGSDLAVQSGLSYAAIAFNDAMVSSVSSARSRTEAYRHRARTRALTGDHAGAMADLDQAEQVLRDLGDQAIRERNANEIRTARASVLSDMDCHASLANANAALAAMPKAEAPLRLADLLVVRAKCREASGDIEGARTDLLAAIDAFEQKRSSLQSIHDRAQAFEQERSAFKRLIEIEADRPAGAARALAIAERGRAGTVLESWITAPRRSLDPSVARRDLPDGTGLVYYETLSQKTLVWVLTRDRIDSFSRPIGERALEQAVARIARRIRDGATLERLAPDTTVIYESLIRPALEVAGEAATIFFVPDGPLYALSFGAVPDRAGRPLIAERNIGITPSMTGFLAASHRLMNFSPESVLAIGDGHDPRATGLPLLRWADVEAARVGGLYPQQSVLTKEAATKSRLSKINADVLHFSGHTVTSERFPTSSRLLLAPGEGASASGAWLASEIVEQSFPSTGVVVLSTCNSAAGKFIAGEGILSVGRAFFAAGVPSIIASLWPVEDDVVDLMVSFHRELRSGKGPASALRAAQLAFLESAGFDTPVRRWGGFLAYGGSTLFGAPTSDTRFTR